MSAARILAPDPQPELALDGEHGLPLWAAALDMGARLPFDAAVERGVLAKPTHGNIIRLAPPLVITAEQIDEVVDVIDRSLAALDGAAAL